MRRRAFTMSGSCHPTERPIPPQDRARSGPEHGPKRLPEAAPAAPSHPLSLVLPNCVTGVAAAWVRFGAEAPSVLLVRFSVSDNPRGSSWGARTARTGCRDSGGFQSTPWGVSSRGVTRSPERRRPTDAVGEDPPGSTRRARHLRPSRPASFTRSGSPLNWMVGQSSLARSSLDPVALGIPVLRDLPARLHPRRLAGHLRVVRRVVELDLALPAPQLQQRLEVVRRRRRCRPTGRRRRPAPAPRTGGSRAGR